MTSDAQPTDGRDRQSLLREIGDITRLACRVWRSLASREKWHLGLGFVLMAIGAVLTNVPAVVLGLLVNRILGTDEVNLTMAAPYLGVVGAALIVRQTLDVARRFLVERTATGVERDIRHQMVTHLVRLPLRYFQQHRSGEINGRVNRGVEGYVHILKLAFLDFLPAVALAVAAAAAAITRNATLGLLMVAVVPVGLAIVLAQIRSEKGIRLDIKATKERMDGTTQEILDGIEPVRALAAEEHVVGKLALDLDRVQSVELRHHVRMSLFDAAKYGNEGLFQIAVIAVAVVLAGRGSISPGEVLTAALLFGSIVAPLRELHRILDESHEATLHAADVFDLLDEPVDASFAAGGPCEPTPGGTPLLEAIGVAFSYDGRRSVLSNLDLSVGRGEFLGICGASHSGKSTLVRLFAGLYPPDEGAVQLAGIPIRAYDHGSRSRLIGYVPQVPWLFSGTIAENIACGYPATTEEIAAAAGLAQVSDEIEALPSRYDTIISEKGADLSGGQRQRIALARALVRRPAVLLLDEATSALDNLTEQRVMENLGGLTGLTVIAIAHRLTTLHNADRIVVLDHGTLLEVGSFEALYKSGGAFTSLVDAAQHRGGQDLSELLEPVVSGARAAP